MHLNMKRVLISSAIASCLAPFSMNSFAVDAPVAGDTYISSVTPSQNFGVAPELIVDAGHDSYIRVNLATLPPGTTGAQISKATMLLWVNRISSTGLINVLPVTSAWDESTLNAQVLPSAGAVVSSVRIDPTSLN